jgi:hypothetical protein
MIIFIELDIMNHGWGLVLVIHFRSIKKIYSQKTKKMFNEYFILWAVTNIISLVLIGFCYKWPSLGSFIWGIIFLFAGVYNGFTAMHLPESYQIYSETAVYYYQEFIKGIFAEQARVFIMFIVLSQLLISFGLFFKENFYKIALIGAMIFLIAITPLGIGSAFPATLLMTISLFILYKKVDRV